MSNPWCPAPESVTKNLSWTSPSGETLPFWIKIKKFLNVGEKRRVETAGWKGVTGLGGGGGASENAEIRIDWKGQSFARSEAYLIDWSLEDDKHNRMPLNRNSLEALHDEVFDLIENAISEHVKEMDEEKKARASSSSAALTSA